MFEICKHEARDLHTGKALARLLGSVLQHRPARRRQTAKRSRRLRQSKNWKRTKLQPKQQCSGFGHVTW